MPKKPSKKEEERLRKEEEARLAALLEEERLEQERLQREEEEKRLAEEKRQWLEIESGRMEAERAEFVPLLGRHAKQLVAEEIRGKKKEEWENFIACTHLPDLTQDSELSTFITLWEEEPDRVLEKVLKETQQACDVIEGLEKMAAHAFGQKEYTLVDKYRNYMKRLRQLIKYKLDHASAEMLDHLEPYTDPKDNTCQYSIHTLLQRFGMWVNTTRNVRIKEIKYWDDLGLKTDIPRTIILQTVAVRMYHCRKDLVSPFKSGDYFTIGGVLFIECLEVPSLPKPLKSHVPDVKDSGNWNVVMITKEKGEAQRQSYPPIDPTTGHMQTVGVPPMKVEWLLPADVLIPEGIAPIVGWWDERKKEGGDHESGGEWNDEGINEITLEERDEGRVLSFLTMHLTALAILQRRWACFPFQSWMLQPMAPNKAMLTLQLRGGFNIKFEIGAGGCRLLHPAEESLRPIREKELPPMELLRRLQNYGLNLIPIDDDANEISIPGTAPYNWDCPAVLKTRDLETRVCSGISMLAPGFTLCHSHLNATLGPKEATVKVVQTTNFQQAAVSPDDPTFRTLLFRERLTDKDLDYCCLAPPTLESASHSMVTEDGLGIMVDREGQNLTPPAVGLETRYFPMSAVKEIADDIALGRCEEASPSFTEGVRIMLEAMRLFSFCAPTLPASPEEPKAEGEEGEGGEGGATEVAEGVAAAEGGEGVAVVGEGGEVQADAPPA